MEPNVVPLRRARVGAIVSLYLYMVNFADSARAALPEVFVNPSY